MIEDSLVESARLIRNRFNLLNETLLGYEEDVRKLAAYFIKISEELKIIGTNVSQKDTITDLRDKVLQKLGDLEIESDRVCNKINNINLEIEKLQKEEMDLYLVIKKRHPSLPDDDIKVEIQRRIDI